MVSQEFFKRRGLAKEFSQPEFLRSFKAPEIGNP